MVYPEDSTGPVPQGAPPAGDEAPAGPSPTGHPSSAHPMAEQEAPAGPSPTGHPTGSVEPPEAAPEADAVGAPGGPPVIEESAGLEQLAVDYAVAEAEEAIAEDVDALSRLTAERDDYLDQLRRLQADFENYKKRIVRQQTEHLERAAEDLVGKLLPVLDTFDLALAHGTEGVEPIYRSLLDILASTGLERVDPMGEPFDPNHHDAVLHESAEDGGAVPEVIEVLRAGYRFKGKLLRPAMVRVKG
jgi:molecular chaperone GrpE